jgi:hypothetical protein
MKHIRRLALVLSVGLAASCGGDSDGDDDPGPGGGGQLDTGLPDATPLSDLTPAQYASACEELRSDVSNRLGPEESVRGACEVLGAAATNTASECDANADTCVEQTEDGTHPLLTPGVRESLDFTQFDCGDAGELEGCDVTIAEFEQCLNDRMAVVERLLTDNSCANAASVDPVDALGLANIDNLESPPSCARMDAECPTAGPFAAPE